MHLLIYHVSVCLISVMSTTELPFNRILKFGKVDWNILDSKNEFCENHFLLVKCSHCT